MDNKEKSFIVINIEIERKIKNNYIEVETFECENYSSTNTTTLINNQYTEISVCDSYYCLNNGATIKCSYISYEEQLDFDEDYDCICDKSLAIAIYNKIKNNHSNLSDELILKYLNASLYNIRTKQKTEAVQKKRIKRLGLHPKFNNWDIDSIIQYK